MSTLTITRGLPASGKTGWAKAWVAVDPANRARVNRDDLRGMLYGVTSGLTWEQEGVVTTSSRNAVKALLAAGKDVVADDMNLRPRYVREWARFVAANGFELDVFELPLSIEDSIERDRVRGLFGDRHVGRGAIEGMAKYLTKDGHLQPLPDSIWDVFDAAEATDRYVPLVGTPRAIVVDIDGTLALHDGRSPYDMTKVLDDLPNWPVIEAVNAARQAGFEIIFCSGRNASARKDTRRWLNKYVTCASELLLMRAVDDQRKDAIVKRELFDKYIRDDYNVQYVLDDRQQVVDMWRELGLTVFQVAPGDF